MERARTRIATLFPTSIRLNDIQRRKYPLSTCRKQNFHQLDRYASHFFESSTTSSSSSYLGRVKRSFRGLEGNPRLRRRRLEENTVLREDATSLNRGVSKRNGVCRNFVPLLRSDVVESRRYPASQPLPGSILNEIIEKRVEREDSPSSPTRRTDEWSRSVSAVS